MHGSLQMYSFLERPPPRKQNGDTKKNEDIDFFTLITVFEKSQKTHDLPFSFETGSKKI